MWSQQKEVSVAADIKSCFMDRSMTKTNNCNWLGDSTLHMMLAWCRHIIYTCLHMILTKKMLDFPTGCQSTLAYKNLCTYCFIVAMCLQNSNSPLLFIINQNSFVGCCDEKLPFSTIHHAPARLHLKWVREDKLAFKINLHRGCNTQQHAEVKAQLQTWVCWGSLDVYPKKAQVSG